MALDRADHHLYCPDDTNDVLEPIVNRPRKHQVSEPELPHAKHSLKQRRVNASLICRAEILPYPAYLREDA